MFVRSLGSIFCTSPQLPSPNLNFLNTLQPEQANNNTLSYTAISPRGSRYNFTFKYERVGSIWRAYIINSPSYGSRSTGAHDTHRLNDGRYYVCWTPEPQRLDEITQVSKLWADATAKYIETGVFPTG
jgi:hypothetical protein